MLISIVERVRPRHTTRPPPPPDASVGWVSLDVGVAVSQNISTPIITAKLVQDDSKTSARVVKAKIEKTTLGQVRNRTGSQQLRYIRVARLKQLPAGGCE